MARRERAFLTRLLRLRWALRMEDRGGSAVRNRAFGSYPSRRKAILAYVGFDQGHHRAAFSKSIEIICPRLHHLHTLGPIIGTMRISSAHGVRLLMCELALYGIRVPPAHFIQS